MSVNTRYSMAYVLQTRASLDISTATSMAVKLQTDLRLSKWKMVQHVLDTLGLCPTTEYNYRVKCTDMFTLNHGPI